MKLTRRNFIKGVGASSFVFGTSSFAKGQTEFYDFKKIPHATHFGAFYAVVDSKGRFIRADKHESDKRNAIVNEAMMDRHYSDTRIKYPCVRKSFLEGKSGHEKLRGREEFVRVSWDEVMELILKNLKKRR